MTWEEIGIFGIDKTGKKYMLCPKCKESRKKENQRKLCLTVNNEIGNRWYKCHNCNFSGNLDLMKDLSKVKEKSRMPDEIPMVYSQEVQNFLFKKDIPPNIAREQKLYEIKNGENTFLCFPVFYRNQIVNVKFRNLGFGINNAPKFYQINKDDGAMFVFSGLDDIDTDHKEVIITEGETDKLTWISAGYKNVISVPQGAPAINAKNFSDEFRYVNDTYFQEIAKKIDKFILATDGDVAGVSLATNLARLLGKEKCYTLKYPEGYKDSNQIWAGDGKLPKLGQAGIDELYNKSKPIPIKGIIEVKDVREEMERIRKTGFLPGMKTGIVQLDNLFTLKQPYLYTLTGIFGLGKSTFLRWYLSQIVKMNKVKIGVFAPESRPAYREFIKYIEAYSGKKYQEGFPESISNDHLEVVKDIVETHFKIIAPSFVDFEDFGGKVSAYNAKTFKSLFSYLKHLVLTEGINGYVIDPWNTVDHEKVRGENDHDYLKRALDNIHEFNEMYDLFSIVVAHPTKEVKRKDSGNYCRPSIYNISGGMNWGNKTDIGIVCHREPFVQSGADEYEYSKTVPTTIFTDKINVEELGNIGSTKLMIEPNGASFRIVNDDLTFEKPTEVITPVNNDFDKIVPEKEMPF